MAKVEIKNLKKSFGDLHVLKDTVNQELEQNGNKYDANFIASLNNRISDAKWNGYTNDIGKSKEGLKEMEEEKSSVSISEHKAIRLETDAFKPNNDMKELPTSAEQLTYTGIPTSKTTDEKSISQNKNVGYDR